MRRAITLTAVLLFEVLSASAQMRGGYGGGHGAPSGGFRGTPAGGYHGGFHGAPSHGYYAGAVYRSQVPSSRWSVGFSFGYGGFYGHAGYYPYYRHYHYYPYVYPYAYYPYAYAYPYGVSYYDPGTYSYYSYSDTSAYAAQQQQNQQLNAQIYSLNQQVDDLRQQNDDLRDYVQRTDKYSRQPVPRPPDRNIPQSLNEPVQPETPLTVLVFRDGHKIETRNYAVIGNTVWVLSEQRSEKIPLAQLDLEKTRQENEQRGVEFTAPKAQ